MTIMEPARGQDIPVYRRRFTTVTAYRNGKPIAVGHLLSKLKNGVVIYGASCDRDPDLDESMRFLFSNTQFTWE